MQIISGTLPRINLRVAKSLIKIAHGVREAIKLFLVPRCLLLVATTITGKEIFHRRAL
jgi:hypothetical protein